MQTHMGIFNTATLVKRACEELDNRFLAGTAGFKREDVFEFIETDDGTLDPTCEYKTSNVSNISFDLNANNAFSKMDIYCIAAYSNCDVRLNVDDTLESLTREKALRGYFSFDNYVVNVTSGFHLDVIATDVYGRSKKCIVLNKGAGKDWTRHVFIPYENNTEVRLTVAKLRDRVPEYENDMYIHLNNIDVKESCTINGDVDDFIIDYCSGTHTGKIVMPNNDNCFVFVSEKFVFPLARYSYKGYGFELNNYIKRGKTNWNRIDTIVDEGTVSRFLQTIDYSTSWKQAQIRNNFANIEETVMVVPSICNAIINDKSLFDRNKIMGRVRSYLESMKKQDDRLKAIIDELNTEVEIPAPSISSFDINFNFGFGDDEGFDSVGDVLGQLNNFMDDDDKDIDPTANINVNDTFNNLMTVAVEKDVGPYRREAALEELMINSGEVATSYNIDVPDIIVTLKPAFFFLGMLKYKTRNAPRTIARRNR